MTRNLISLLVVRCKLEMRPSHLNQPMEVCSVPIEISGPVPVLKFRTRYSPNKKTYSEFEADGFYAPISYLNGSDNEVVGAILDASFRPRTCDQQRSECVFKSALLRWWCSRKFGR